MITTKTFTWEKPKWFEPTEREIAMEEALGSILQLDFCKRNAHLPCIERAHAALLRPRNPS